MKRFAAMFVAVLLMVEAFLFFGGHMLFDFAKRPYLTGAVIALIIAVIAQAFVELDEKINQLTKRVKELEKRALDNREQS